MTEVVNSANLPTGLSENLYAILSSKTSLPDPLGGTGRKFVYRRRPEPKNLGFGDYPYVVVFSGSVARRSETRTLNGREQDHEHLCEIEVVACDRGLNGKDGKGQEQMDALTNTIFALVNSAAIRQTLRVNGLPRIDVTTTEASIEVEAEALVFRRSLFVGAAGVKRVY